MCYAFAYNRELAKKRRPADQLDQLTDPKYKGKMVASLFLLPRLMGGLSIAWAGTRQEVSARDVVVKQDIMLTRSPREPILNSGERIYGFGEIDFLVRIWEKSGLKIGYVVPEPFVVGQFASSLMAKAPHPNAAKLLAGYLVSPDGKKARAAATSAEDYTATGTSELAKRINSGTAQVVADTVENAERREKAIAQMGPIIAGP